MKNILILTTNKCILTSKERFYIYEIQMSFYNTLRVSAGDRVLDSKSLLVYLNNHL